jgi:hypothetical protein
MISQASSLRASGQMAPGPWPKISAWRMPSSRGRAGRRWPGHTLVDDIAVAGNVLAEKGGLHEHDRRRVKTGTGY